jgi:hypothetical protein
MSKPVQLPTKFSFSIGGYGGENHQFELINGDLLYSGGFGCIDPSAAQIITPSAQKWRNFIANLDAVGVWKWRRHYVDPEILDGTQWSLEISIGDKSKRSEGSNDYPQSGKPGGMLGESDQFDAFLRALSNLVGFRIS